MTAHERSGATATDPAARPGPFDWLRAAVADRESVRSWTQIANDGIVATAGILEGFAGAGASDRTLVTAATTAPSWACSASAARSGPRRPRSAMETAGSQAPRANDGVRRMISV
jgi:hypothetical protein